MSVVPMHRRLLGQLVGRRIATVALGVVLAGLVSVATVVPAAAAAGWSIVPSPNGGSGINVLDGVSCRRAASCTAVGYSYDGSLGAYRTLVESEHGASWSIDPSPNQGTGDNEFLGTSCPSSSSCEAVGFSTINGVNQTLIESWNGVRWSIVPSPNRGSSYNILAGVSCTSARSCVAVGYYNDPDLGATQTLIESWDGFAWSIVPSPSNGPAQNILYGVSCASARSCQAVGYYTNNASQGVTQTLIESWNGSTWSIAPSPNNGAGYNYLQGVSCASARSCQAVGQYGSASVGANQTLIESWNGSTWSIAPSPNTGTNVNSLLGVSCQSPRSCQAVGAYLNSGLGAYQTLIESWDGVSWSTEVSPTNGTAYNVLAAMSCGHARNSCRAVGNYYNTLLGTYHTLIESAR